MTNEMRDTLHQLGWTDELIDSFMATPEVPGAEPEKLDLLADVEPLRDFTEITLTADDIAGVVSRGW